jgi:hypothetical protein
MKTGAIIVGILLFTSVVVISCAWTPGSFEDFNNLGSGISDLVTAAGIVIGGLWVFFRFRRGRESYPRATIVHQLTACKATDREVVISVFVTVTNAGAVQLSLKKMLVRLQRVVPCDAETIEGLRNASKYTEDGPWPVIGERALADAEADIEPGENEAFPFGFIIDRDVEVFSVYSHVENTANPGKGWSHTTWHRTKELLA